MTRAEAAAYKRALQYRAFMGLNDWAIRITFERDEEQNLGTCKPSPQYKEADLNFDLDLHVLPDRELDETLRHELAHMILAPLGSMAAKLCQDDKVLRGLWEDAEDLVATHIARMSVWDSLNE